MHIPSNKKHKELQHEELITAKCSYANSTQVMVENWINWINLCSSAVLNGKDVFFHSKAFEFTYVACKKK